METEEEVNVNMESENLELRDENIDIITNQGLQHENLMQYSQFKIDFIQTFGEKLFVLIIGKLNLFFFDLIDYEL